MREWGQRWLWRWQTRMGVKWAHTKTRDDLNEDALRMKETRSKKEEKKSTPAL
jgi:hypothetical protein